MKTKIRNLLLDLAAENWHVHTGASDCAEKEMTPAHIAREAEKAGLKTVALTDHHHPGQGSLLESQAELILKIAEIKTSVRLVAGAELSAFGVGRFSDSEHENRRLAFRLYATNHYHLSSWEQPREKTARGYKDHMLAATHALLDAGRADCVAHPFQGSYAARASGIAASAISEAYTDAEISLCLEKGKRAKVAFEINLAMLSHEPAFAFRFLRLALETGADLRLGTDAHSLARVETRRQAGKLADAIAAAAQPIRI